MILMQTLAGVARYHHHHPNLFSKFSAGPPIVHKMKHRNSLSSLLCPTLALYITHNMQCIYVYVHMCVCIHATIIIEAIMNLEGRTQK